MNDDELFELYSKVQSEYRRYVAVSSGDGENTVVRVSSLALETARNDWLVWQAELSAVATPEDIRHMLNRRALDALDARKGGKR